MICSNCGEKNDADSKFCIFCGEKTKKQPTKKTEKKKDDSQDDILFIPEQKDNTLRNAILVVLGIIVVLFFLGGDYEENDYENSYDDTEIEQDYDYESDYFPLYQLEITNLDSEWVGYGYDQTFYLTGTIVNSSSTVAQDVELRVDFYRDEELENILDTRYVTIDVVSNNGAYSFREPIYTLNIEGDFWYNAQITSASN